MKNFEDYQNSGWIERITKYEDLREREEYWRLECERKEDNLIRQINEVNTKVDALLFAVNTLLHSETNRNTPNSKKKAKEDKLVKEDTKVENKPNKRGRPKKQKD
jgi:hypothetical protein